MDRHRCGICYKNRIAFNPIHINGRGEVLNPNPIHSDKYCARCLESGFLMGDACPTCHVRYLEPTPLAEDDDEDEDEDEATDMEVDNDIGNIQPDAIQRSPVRTATRPVRDPRRNSSSTTHVPGVPTVVLPVRQPAVVPVQQPAPVNVPNAPETTTEETAQPTRRTAPINKEERKSLTIKQLAALENEIGIPEVHCSFVTGKANKNQPNGICTVSAGLRESIVDKQKYCSEHVIKGAVMMKKRKLEEKRKKDEKDEVELLEWKRYEQKEKAKRIASAGRKMELAARVKAIDDWNGKLTDILKDNGIDDEGSDGPTC